MNYKETAGRLAEYRSQIAEIREKMRSTQAAIEPEEVEDYEFASPKGAVLLSALFGGKDTLFVIHNMGTSCAHCTMWADGFNGVFEHLRDRAGFVVSSPDTPERQQSFARRPGLEVSHGLDPGHDIRGRYGLSPGWALDAGRFCLQTKGRQDPAGGGYLLRAGRRFLRCLAPF
jgi:Bacterial protein of unknown function (DUF899)